MNVAVELLAEVLRAAVLRALVRDHLKVDGRDVSVTERERGEWFAGWA